MLHDRLLSRSDDPEQSGERRRAGREAAPRVELVMLWHHDTGTTIRYSVVDMNELGVRILTATPLMAGMTGTALKLLPAGKAVNRGCMVRWSRRREDEPVYEAGLRFL